MKPALVMIPQECGPIIREKYLSGCVRHVIREGSFPLVQDLYNDYPEIAPGKFVDTMLGVCSAVYLFIDFGMSPEMKEVMEWATRQNIPVSFVKIVQYEPEYLRLTPEDILYDVSKKTKICMDDLRSKSRKREIADARLIYFKRAREELGKKYSYASIGAEVGGRNHATAMHGEIEATNNNTVSERYRDLYGG